MFKYLFGLHSFSNVMFIISVSSSTQYDHRETNPLSSQDHALDCVPVRQPRSIQIQTNSKAPAFKEPARPKGLEEKLVIAKKITEQSEMRINPAVLAQNPHLSSSKPADVLLRNLQQSSLRLMSEDTDGSESNSFSVSKIADYLGKILERLIFI